MLLDYWFASEFVFIVLLYSGMNDSRL